jgi:GNAT superfamily N-acetyltransferase
MIVIKDIKISQLDEFINSDEYKELKNIPITPQRAASHIYNPKGDKDDVVLFLAYDLNKFIGYLGALSDRFIIGDVSLKVAWLSSMWIDKDYRRQGIAVQLLNHACQKWNSNLLITNYIPVSKKTFEKTGKFTEFKSLQGLRGYLRFNMAEIILLKRPGLKGIRRLLLLFDFLANIINGCRLAFWKAAMNISRMKIEYLNGIDNETARFIGQSTRNNISPKDKAVLEWIKNYPWVLNTPFKDEISRRYEFSVVSRNFNQLYIKIASNNKIIAFLMLTVHGTHLKTPYLFFDSNYGDVVRKVIYAHLLNLKIRTFTTYHPELIKVLRSKRNPFILVRKMAQDSLITKELLQKIKDADKYVLMEGDGDCAFI